MKWKMKNWGSYRVDSCSMLKKDEILLPAVSCRGRHCVPLPSVLFCHSKPLHVLLLCTFVVSCFPPDWQLHLQYPSFSMCTLPPLHILTSTLSPNHSTVSVPFGCTHFLSFKVFYTSCVTSCLLVSAVVSKPQITAALTLSCKTSLSLLLLFICHKSAPTFIFNYQKLMLPKK